MDTQAQANSPEALFERGLARATIGRDDEARADFLAAEPTLGDRARIELALLDLRHLSADKSRDTASQIAERAPDASPLRARALHVLGLAQARLRQTTAATDSLLRAAEIYRAAHHNLKCAEVYDSLGMLHESRGRVDYAMNFFAISLTDKALAGDKQGMAITLGNMGRAHLREGRARDALDCFQRDADLSSQLGDHRGQARSLQDIGRAYTMAGDHAAAEESLLKSLQLAIDSNYADLVFFSRKELAHLYTVLVRHREAEAQIAAAESALPPGVESAARLMLLAARGQLLAAQKNPAAIDLLAQAVEAFAENDLPDLEIASRIVLARALLNSRLKATAENCLTQALRLARSEGYARYLSAITQALTELDLVEGAVEEKPRQLHEGPNAPPGSYILRQRLGSGTFGEVFRAFDPLRNEDIALKKIHLNRLYAPRQRDHLLDSAHLELEAASRANHPGIVKVFAIAIQPDGDLYVTQEFVAGKTLRAVMNAKPPIPLSDILKILSQIASALDALHERGVIHRDIKPENILVRDDNSPVLVDFGIAHIRQSDRLANTSLVGTLQYLAPEQARNKKIDGRADLYSLGVVAYEWLAGCRPLHLRGDTIDDMILDLTTRPAPPLTDFRPDLAGPISDLLASLLAKHPRKRPVSAADLAETLQQLSS
jgi:tetratricopeptide (TPR) repeat protein